MDIFPLIDDQTFKQEAELAIHEFCKEVEEITFIEHGADNIVALVNKQFVFRFPRSEAAGRRLAYETALLQKIGNRIDAVAIPKLVQVRTQPLYVVAEYIPGGHLSGQEIQSLTEEEQVTIGKRIALFISQLNQVMSYLEVRRWRLEADLDKLEEPWAPYFERIFEKQQLPNARLRPIVDEHYKTWKDFAQHEAATFTVHDDLHPSNLLFLGSRLNGIVDFGDTNVGSIESELRWLYLTGDVVLKSAIAHYQELTGNTVDYEHVREWAIMHELSTYTYRLAKEDTESFPFKRAQDNLRRWIPNFPL